MFSLSVVLILYGQRPLVLSVTFYLYDLLSSVYMYQITFDYNVLTNSVDVYFYIYKYSSTPFRLKNACCYNMMECVQVQAGLV